MPSILTLVLASLSVTVSSGAPAAASASQGGTQLATHVTGWEYHAHTLIPFTTVYRLDLNRGHAPLVIARGRDGVRVTVTRFTVLADGDVGHTVTRYVMKMPRPRIVDVPLGTYGELDRYALARYGFIAQSEVQMVATAYTAHCYGCSGITAIGRPAGRGIVAVDPRVIPLGSRLYIPGYGFALAGDTGGDIRGNRVDLGFGSYGEAIQFGRREITVYRLK